MDKEWKKLMSTTQLYEAKVLEARLKEADIECYIMNKQDSAYVMIGEIQIYVQEKDVTEAIALLDNKEDG